jgi:hypothetical protein
MDMEIHDYGDDDFGFGFDIDFDEGSDPITLIPVVVPRSAFASEEDSKGVITHNSCCNNSH